MRLPLVRVVGGGRLRRLGRRRRRDLTLLQLTRCMATPVTVSLLRDDVGGSGRRRRRGRWRGGGRAPGRGGVGVAVAGARAEGAGCEPAASRPAGTAAAALPRRGAPAPGGLRSRSS